MNITMKIQSKPALFNCPGCEKGKFSVWAVKYLKGANCVCPYCGAVVEVLEDTIYDT